MKNNLEHLEEITKVCFDQLLEFREDSEPIFYREESKGLTFQDWGDGKEKKLTDDEAKELLQKQIKESLEKCGKVFLYTCRDNSLINIEDPDSIVGEDIIELYEEQELPNQIREVLYIGFD